MENKKVIEQWNNVAQVYKDTQRTAPNNLTNWQILLDILGNVNGKNILDAGCGDGFFSNKLFELGGNVCACDGSSNLIKFANEDFKNIKFELCDLTKKLPYKDNEFDIIVSSLVIMDIGELDTFFEEAYRILKINGRLVFSIVHPAFFLADWECNENKEKLYKKVYNYYKLTTKTLQLWGETTHYHRPISWYSQLFKKHNFVIQEIAENPKNLEEFKPIKKHQKEVPLFICFDLCKANKNNNSNFQ